MTAALGAVTEGAAGAAASQAVSGDSVVAAARRAQGRPIVDRTGMDLTGNRARPAPFTGQRGGRQGSGTPGARARGGSGGAAPPRAGATNLSMGGSGAHKLVIAEFVLVILLIGISPIMTRKPAGGHVYLAGDFVRLTAACLLFFVLALAANNPRSARFAAAFGGLVTLGVAFNSLGALRATANLFIPPAKRFKGTGPAESIKGQVSQP